MNDIPTTGRNFGIVETTFSPITPTLTLTLLKYPYLTPYPNPYPKTKFFHTISKLFGFLRTYFSTNCRVPQLNIYLYL